MTNQFEDYPRPGTMRIVRAKPGDAAVLTEIAFAAKRHWGYPESWIDHWTSALTITSPYLAQHPVYVAIIGERRVGFGGFRLEGDAASLEHLWVLPAAMKSGVGRSLFLHVEKSAHAAGATRIKVESDPNAEGFYLRMGAKTVGQVRSPIAGEERFLPLMEKTLG